ncbi:uncharacterized protein LOC111713243 isoform X2 [Eurytemora carolleeae]|uniref:uncharacterized protein LOC111713243 isoform X2 n=1 Tax=Eurytemora carolleeae TaxID=1294199 RepID=UPI000C7879B4|nr:uncharacterized protein LOC111713243 isoform X2 [Eurytemora carolleeae]|eukprot:XP_023343841.1 uncharacterized protein LOC111713243 isoform X2 [Eurytemora affinis]
MNNQIIWSLSSITIILSLGESKKFLVETMDDQPEGYKGGANGDDYSLPLFYDCKTKVECPGKSHCWHGFCVPVDSYQTQHGGDDEEDYSSTLSPLIWGDEEDASTTLATVNWGHDKCKTASDCPEPYNYCINNGICGSI